MKKLIAVNVITVFIFSAPAVLATDQNSTNSGSFEGLSLGLNLGAAIHNDNANSNDQFLQDNGTYALSDTNIAEGVQFGYDWEIPHSVFGVIGEWAWTGLNSLRVDEPYDPNDSYFVQSDLKWFATIRGRLGLRVDYILIYLSSGPAVALIENKWHDGSDTITFTKAHWGWIGSVGTELKIFEKISIGGELYHMQFADKEIGPYANTDPPDPPEGVSFGHNNAVWGTRLIINYRFGTLDELFPS
ncbi:outer membrane protein [Bdellovibrionota bacterium]